MYFHTIKKRSNENVDKYKLNSNFFIFVFLSCKNNYAMKCIYWYVIPCILA